MKSFAFPIHIGELNGTPVGDLRLVASDQGLIAVEWADRQPDFDSYLRPFEEDLIAPYADELREYLEGKRREFTFPINWAIFRPFQREALQTVFKIPYGDSLPSPDRHRWKTPRLWRRRRIEDQGMVVEDGRGGHRVRLG
jgi:6-O-methylguanine DNA methyltransferase-like protein